MEGGRVRSFNLLGRFREPDGVADGVFGNDITAGAASANGDVFEMNFFLGFPQAWGGLEVDFHGIGRAGFGGVGRKVEDSGTRFAFREVVFLVSGNAADGEVFCEDGSGFAVAINHAIGEGVGFVAVKEVDMKDIFSKEGFVADF